MSHAMQGHPRQIGSGKSSNKMWSTGEGKGNPLQYSFLENPTDSMKTQKDMTMEDKPAWKVSSMLLGKSGGQLLIAPGKMK